MNKILIIRFSSIGDIVLTTPVIRCLKQQLMKSEIHLVTKKQFLPVVIHNPCLDKIHTIENDVDEIEQLLKKENFDFVTDLHNNLRSNILKRKLKRPSATFKKLNFKKWLMVNFKIDRLPRIHIVDRYFEAVSSLGVKNDFQGLDYFLSPEDVTDLPFPENEYVAIAIGAQHATKKLPYEKLKELLGSTRRNIVLLGGKEDELTGDELAETDRGRIKNYAGKIPLNTSAYLISKSAVVVAHDTGLMHIAAAFRKKIISVWGNTIPEFGMYPYIPGKENGFYISEVKGLSCRPCSKIGYSKCPRGHFKCMYDQDIRLISDRIEESF